jgi:hypothetical protein
MDWEKQSEEDLIALLMEELSESSVLEELTIRLRPIILCEALKYRSQLPYETDDYVQEGRILLWRIALKKNYRRGRFKSYFARAIRFRFSNVYRDFVLKNYVCIGCYVDLKGNAYEVLVEADYAKQYREKHREYCRESYRKKHGLSKP